MLNPCRFYLISQTWLFLLHRKLRYKSFGIIMINREGKAQGCRKIHLLISDSSFSKINISPLRQIHSFNSYLKKQLLDCGWAEGVHSCCCVFAPRERIIEGDSNILTSVLPDTSDNTVSFPVLVLPSSLHRSHTICLSVRCTMSAFCFVFWVWSIMKWAQLETINVSNHFQILYLYDMDYFSLMLLK